MIAGGEFQRPLEEGADLMTGSTYKSFRGTLSGIQLLQISAFPVFPVSAAGGKKNKLSATLFSFEDRKKQFQKMVDILDKLFDNQRYSTEKVTL